MSALHAAHSISGAAAPQATAQHAPPHPQRHPASQAKPATATMDDERSLNDVLVDCIRAAGGSKAVGPTLWPEKTPEAAQRLLLDCMNDDRPAHLKPEQVLLVLKLARAAGHHGGVDWMLASLGYAPTTPIAPRDEVAELQRQFIEAQRGLAALMEKMGSIAASIGGGGCQ